MMGLPPALQLVPHLSVCKLLRREWGFSVTRHSEAKISLPAHCYKTVRNKQDKDRDRPAIHTKALLDVWYNLSPSRGCRGSGQNSILSLTPRATYPQIPSATLEMKNDFAAEG